MGPMGPCGAKLPTPDRSWTQGQEVIGQEEADVRWFCTRGSSRSLAFAALLWLIPPQDHDKLSQLMKQYFSIVLETKETSVKGWNWGVTDFQGALVHTPLIYNI